MGVHAIKMPDIGEGIAEVELVAWHVKVGDVVAEDQILADVMTDKATVEIPSSVAGTVLALGGAVGQVMAVGSEVIRIEVEGAGLAEHWEYGAVGTEVVTGVGKAVGSPPMAQPDAVHTPASDTGILQGQGWDRGCWNRTRWYWGWRNCCRWNECRFACRHQSRNR